jgi:hypothetical protein
MVILLLFGSAIAAPNARAVAVGSAKRVPIIEVADRGAMAYVHVPRVSKSIEALQRSSLVWLLSQMVPQGEARALARAGASDLLLASYRRPEPGQSHTILWMDAGTALPATRQLVHRWLAGRRFQAKGQSRAGELQLTTLRSATATMTTFAGLGRVGWSTDAERAARALDASPSPLAIDPSFTKLVARTPDAVLRARVDVQRVFGWIARTDRGPAIAGVVRRLGLAGVQAIELQVHPPRAPELLAEARVVTPGPHQDVLAAWGSPISHVVPSDIPPTSRCYVRGSLRPARLWQVAEKLMFYEMPIEASLARAQLDSVEQRLQKRLLEQGLGDETHQWTWICDPGRQVLLAGVKDARLTGDILAAYADLLSTLFPGLRVEHGKLGEARLLLIHGQQTLAMAFGGDRMVIGQSQAALGSALESGLKARRRPGKSLSGVPVLAYGRLSAAALGHFQPMVKLEGQVELAVRQSADGFVADLVLRNR